MLVTGNHVYLLRSAGRQHDHPRLRRHHRGGRRGGGPRPLLHRHQPPVQQVCIQYTVHSTHYTLHVTHPLYAIIHCPWHTAGVGPQLLVHSPVICGTDESCTAGVAAGHLLTPTIMFRLVHFKTWLV